MTTIAVVTVVMDERVNPTTPMMYPAGVTESDMREKHPISSGQMAMSVQVQNIEKDGMESETSRRAAESTKLP